MTKEEKIAAIDFTIKVLQAKKQRLESNLVVAFDEDPCPPGKIRNAEGECVKGLG